EQRKESPAMLHLTMKRCNDWQTENPLSAHSLVQLLISEPLGYFWVTFYPPRWIPTVACGVPITSEDLPQEQVLRKPIACLVQKTPSDQGPIFRIFPLRNPSPWPRRQRELDLVFSEIPMDSRTFVVCLSQILDISGSTEISIAPTFKWSPGRPTMRCSSPPYEWAPIST